MTWTTSYHHYDGQGSTVALTDESENVTDTYNYSAFGEMKSSTGTTENPFRYNGEVGYYLDDESEDYYVRARVYEPRTIRWLSVDPLSYRILEGVFNQGTPDSGGYNTYAYVSSRPTGMVDPSGNIPRRPIAMGMEGGTLWRISNDSLTKLDDGKIGFDSIWQIKKDGGRNTPSDWWMSDKSTVEYMASDCVVKKYPLYVIDVNGPAKHVLDHYGFDSTAVDICYFKITTERVIGYAPLDEVHKGGFPFEYSFVTGNWKEGINELSAKSFGKFATEMIGSKQRWDLTYLYLKKANCDCKCEGAMSEYAGHADGEEVRSESISHSFSKQAPLPPRSIGPALPPGR